MGLDHPVPRDHRGARGLLDLARGAFGAVFGIFAASLSALGALLSIPAYPFLSLSIFAIDVLVIYGLAAYGAQGRRAIARSPAPPTV